MLNMAGNFCTVKGIKFSQRSIDAGKEMDRIADLSSYLDKIMTIVPLFQIFATRKTYFFLGNLATQRNIYTYDWQNLADTFDAIGQIKKKRLRDIAINQQMVSMGEESKFWGCVANALY